MSDDGKLTFDFGSNWREFSKNKLSDRHLEEAVCYLQEIIEIDGLTHQSFLDIGCGSGLFSLSAAIILS